MDPLGTKIDPEGTQISTPIAPGVNRVSGYDPDLSLGGDIRAFELSADSVLRRTVLHYIGGILACRCTPSLISDSSIRAHPHVPRLKKLSSAT
jgi:hypothetical protein